MCTQPPSPTPLGRSPFAVGIGCASAVVLGFFVAGFFLTTTCWMYQQVVLLIVPIVSTLAIVGTIGFSLLAMSGSRLAHVAKATLLGVWIVGPPLWFSFEYFNMYRPNFVPSVDSACGVTWEHFKYGQESAAKIWAAISLFLGALYFKEPDA